MLKDFLQKMTESLLRQGRYEYDGPELTEIIKNPTINMVELPFRHIVIDDFFTDSFYEQLSQEYKQILDRGLAEKNDNNRFSRFKTYDAYSFTPNPFTESVINLFRTVEWKDFFAKAFDIEVNNDEILSLHHHKINSKTGWVHSDYALCAMSDDPLPNGINPWYYQCKYEDSTEGAQPNTRKVMRAITLIYYLNNECNGNYGGSTALFDKDKEPVEFVTPKNNRLMAFEVSPISYHAFQTNTHFPRNSITQWFHQDYEKMMNRFNNTQHVAW